MPEIRAYVAKARLRRGVELVKLANRIEALKMQEDEGDDAPGQADVPANAHEAAGKAIAAHSTARGLNVTEAPPTTEKKKLSRLAKGAIFREIVLAKVREIKEKEEREKMEKDASERAKKSSATA
jgi:calcium/calmodulin-dependent protein kinase I